MQLKTERVELFGPYIDIPLNHNTLNAVLKSPIDTIHRLYLIANGIKETQSFAELISDEYELIATVKTECTFVGDAREQVKSITVIRELSRNRHKYIVRCELKHLMSNRIKYNCRFEHISKDAIYQQIQECINDLKLIQNEENN